MVTPDRGQTTAWRSSRSGFDTELPPQARAELARRKPPGRRPSGWPMVLLIGLVISFGIFNHPAPRAPEPFRFPISEAKESPARVADDGKSAAQTVPRAQLVRLPWRTGQSVRLLMPYNLEVQASYRGMRPSEDLLPQKGNHIGDMYVVQNTPWVWLAAPGAAKASWIDP